MKDDPRRSGGASQCKRTGPGRQDGLCLVAIDEGRLYEAESERERTAVLWGSWWPGRLSGDGARCALVKRALSCCRSDDREEAEGDGWEEGKRRNRHQRRLRSLLRRSTRRAWARPGPSSRD